jgi:pimeloyl-ACP methyl ester carboxylesterase
MSELIPVANTDDAGRVGDVVFVHGLGGNPRAYWMADKDKPETFWPAWIGEDVPGVGVWSLGYDAAKFAWQGDPLWLVDRAKNALQRLDLKRIGARPVVFIGHSMGGLLIKRMIRHGLDLGNARWKAIADQTKGICFIATPHSGSDLANYVKFLARFLATNAVEDLKANDPRLLELNEWYRHHAFTRFTTEVYCETRVTGWNKLGVVVVDRGSADPGIPGVVPIPLEEDHLSICKPVSRESLLYEGVLRLVKECLLTPRAAGESIELKSEEGGAAALGGNGSDLNISPVRAPRRLIPLDGHPVLSPSAGPSPLYTGGFHVSFTLAHNGAGKKPINLHSMELEVVRYTPGARAEYAYRIEGTALVGAGVAKPHVFSVMVFGERVAPTQWVTDAKLGTFSEARSANFFDTDDPRILTFAAGGADIEEIRGTVLVQEPGLYALRFVFHYSVAGADRHKATELIDVYADE